MQKKKKKKEEENLMSNSNMKTRKKNKKGVWQGSEIKRRQFWEYEKNSNTF